MDDFGDLTGSEHRAITAILNAPIAKRPPAPDWDAEFAKIFHRDSASPQPAKPRKRIKFTFYQPDYPAPTTTNTKSVIPFDISINHDPAKPFPQDHDEKEVKLWAKRVVVKYTQIKFGNPPSYYFKRAKCDTECAVVRDEIRKLFLEVCKKQRRRMIKEEVEYKKLEARIQELGSLPEVEFLTAAQLRDQRLAKELQAKIDATAKAEDLLARFSPEMLATKYEADTAREARRAAISYDLTIAEGAVAYAENTAHKLEQILEEDRKEAALRNADARIKQWEADMLAKIGEADRVMKAIDDAHDVAERKSFDPLAEMDKLLAPAPEPKSLGGFSKSMGEFRF